MKPKTVEIEPHANVYELECASYVEALVREGCARAYATRVVADPVGEICRLSFVTDRREKVPADCPHICAKLVGLNGKRLDAALDVLPEPGRTVFAGSGRIWVIEGYPAALYSGPLLSDDALAGLETEELEAEETIRERMRHGGAPLSQNQSDDGLGGKDMF